MADEATPAALTFARLRTEGCRMQAQAPRCHAANTKVAAYDLVHGWPDDLTMLCAGRAGS